MPKWTIKEETVLRDNYGKVKIDEIERLIPRHTRGAIQKWAQKLKLSGDNSVAQRRYTFDESFFDSVTMQTCYWAGYIAADGCVANGGLLSFSISLKDRELLDNLVEQVGFTGRVREFVSNGHQYCRLQIWGAYRWQQMLKEHWNITSRKSNTLIPPNIIDDELCYAFIIGYFDGDGGITWSSPTRKYRHLIMSFCGTYDMMYWINQKLLPLSGRLSSISPNGNSSTNFNIRFGYDRCANTHSALRSTPGIPKKLSRKWIIDEYRIQTDFQ